MRFLIPLLLLLLTGFASAQHAGKTDAQILKMGMDAWSDYYGTKVGSSTADMADAARIYGQVAVKRNDALLGKQLDGDFREKILKLRKLLNEYGGAAIDLMYAYAGGGTIHIPMWAAVSGGVEDTLYPILTASGMKPKPMIVSMVTKQLAADRAKSKALSKDPSNAYFKYDDAKKAIAKMQACYDGVVKIAKTMSRADSDRVLGFCFERLKNASE